MNAPRPLAVAVAVTAAVLVAVAGCAGGPSRRPAASAPLDELKLISSPAPLDLDGRPGADAVRVKIYGVRRDTAKTVAITSGVLEVYLYEGVLAALPPEDSAPLETWTFAAAALERHAFRTLTGMDYRLVLRWKPERAVSGDISLVACYRAGPSRPPICSAPVSLAISSR